jgi:hypothetical protein
MSISLEQRVAALEQQIAYLQRDELGVATSRAWLGDLYGRFAADPVFEQAMKLGKKYRKSLRPRATKAKSNR